METQRSQPFFRKFSPTVIRNDWPLSTLTLIKKINPKLTQMERMTNSRALATIKGTIAMI